MEGVTAVETFVRTAADQGGAGQIGMAAEDIGMLHVSEAGALRDDAGVIRGFADDLRAAGQGVVDIQTVGGVHDCGPAIGAHGDCASAAGGNYASSLRQGTAEAGGGAPNGSGNAVNASRGSGRRGSPARRYITALRGLSA